MILNSWQSIVSNPCPSWDCRAQLHVPWCHPRLPNIQIHHLRQSLISLMELRRLQIQISKFDYSMSMQLQLRSKQLFEILVIWELRLEREVLWDLFPMGCVDLGINHQHVLFLGMLTCLGLFMAWRLITAKNSVSINQKDVRSERSRKMYTPQTCQLHW